MLLAVALQRYVFLVQQVLQRHHLVALVLHLLDQLLLPDLQLVHAALVELDQPLQVRVLLVDSLS